MPDRLFEKFFANDRALMRGRRRYPFGVWQPSHEPGLKFDLDPALLLGTLVDNDPVSTALDGSGYGRNYSAAGSARPTFKTNVINGWPVFRFATDDVLTPAGSAVTYGENNTVIVVCTERTSGSGYIFAGNGDQGNPAFITGFLSRDFEYFNAQTTPGSTERQIFATTAAAGFHTLSLVREDGGVFGEMFQGYIDNARSFNATVIGNANWSGRTLAKIGDFSAGDFYNGDLARILIYDKLSGLNALNRVIHGLSARYNLSFTFN